MLENKLSKYNIILGSASARRKELLKEMGVNFIIKTTKQEESYPKQLNQTEIARFLAKQKAKFISKELSGNFLLITADTIVIQNSNIIHKPNTKEHASKILQSLSNTKHKVISGVCLKSKTKEITFSSITNVWFNKLSKEEISYYIEKFNPFDKAGAYGIQEWIGYIGIKKINGSYNNVVGLPTADLHQKLKLFI